jgi:4-amino-4-deoxy-L-arabinose transferase-like glycosyltransferase
MSSRLRSFRGRIALIAAAGLVVRLVYVFGPGRHVVGFGDYHYFHWSANLIADGHWFVDPFEQMSSGRLRPSATHPPLWTLLLGGVSWLGGTGYLAHRAVGCVVGAVAVLLVGLLGRRVGGPRVGLAAAVLAAAYPVLIGADGSLMSESLYGVFLLGALLLALRLRERQSVRVAVALGVVIGLAGLTRSEGLILLVLLVLPVAVVRAPPGGWLRLGACALASFVVIAPWLARDWVAFDRPVLISTNDGSLLAGANCGLTYHGKSLGIWTTDCLSPRAFENEADQALRWRDEGASYAGDHLGRLPVVVAARVLRTFDFYQPWRMTPFAEGRLLKADKAGVIAYWLLLPFALGGAWLLRKRRLELLVLLAPVAMVVLQSAFGYGFPRFRHPADLVLVVLGAVAVVGLLDRFRGRQAPARPQM